MTMTSGKEMGRKSGSNDAITAPLKIVGELYSKRAGPLSDALPRDFGVQAYFEELVGDESVAGKVRSLLPVSPFKIFPRRSRLFLAIFIQPRLICRLITSPDTYSDG